MALRVCIVDDSAFIQRSLVRLFAGDPRIDVVGTAVIGTMNPDMLEHSPLSTGYSGPAPELAHIGGEC